MTWSLSWANFYILYFRDVWRRVLRKIRVIYVVFTISLSIHTTQKMKFSIKDFFILSAVSCIRSTEYSTYGCELSYRSEKTEVKKCESCFRIFNSKYELIILLSFWICESLRDMHWGNHSVKGVRTRRYSAPHFPAFRLNTERFSVCQKMRTRITPNTDTF